MSKIDTYIYVTWLIHIFMSLDSFIRMPCPIDIRDMTHSYMTCLEISKTIHIYMSLDSFIYMCYLTRLYICASSLIHIYISADSFIHMPCPLHIRDMSCPLHIRHIWMGHVTYERVMSHMDESCHIWMKQCDL